MHLSPNEELWNEIPKEFLTNDSLSTEVIESL